jgi:hypothetical protein
MKNVYIIHGWGADSTSDWIPWLKKQLTERGYNVTAPDMPETDKPEIKPWVDKLKEILPAPDEDTILIGHSIGCQTILRYLADLPGAKVGKIILICPWFDLENLQEDEWPTAEPWIKTPIDFAKVKAAAKNIIALFSDNDPVVPVRNEAAFKKLVGAETKIYHNKGHFNAEDGITEIPEILEFID